MRGIGDPAMFKVFVFLVLQLFIGSTSHAKSALIATSSNFLNPLKQLVADFEKTNPYTIEISSGSTGRLYTQITRGAPYDVFLAADNEHPLRLVREGWGVGESRFVYALGRLVVWNLKDGLTVDDAMVRAAQRIALARPKTAPYGRAGHQFLTGRQLLKRPSLLLLQGESVSHALMFARNNSNVFALISLAQALKLSGSYWVVPSAEYSPIVQEALLLKRGEKNPAAIAFIDFLKSPVTRSKIVRLGYGLWEAH